MFLEHAFQIVGVQLLVGSGMNEHLLFTGVGSVAGYVSRFVSAWELRDLEGGARYWAQWALVTVAVLVSGMSAITYVSLGALRKKLKLFYRVLTAPLTEFCESPGAAEAKTSKHVLGLHAASAPGPLDITQQATATAGAVGSRSEALGSEPPCNTLAVSSTGIASSNPPLGGVGKAGQCVELVRPVQPPFEDVELQWLVGQGSFGQVYHGVWCGASVAVKVMTVNRLEGDRQCAPLFEAQLSAELAHPCLVQTFKYSSRQLESDLDEVWIVLEWCDRGTLRQHCQRPRIDEASMEEVFQICADIAGAGSYLHSRGIIHGDLTANNVLLKSSASPIGYVCKICDFGLARILEGDSKGLSTAQLGTVTHMPPELFKLDEQDVTLTPKADVYAAGILLWQVVTGKAPWEGLNPPQIVVHIATGMRLRLPENVPGNLLDVFEQCTDPEPDNRPTFEELNEFFTCAFPQGTATGGAGAH